MITIQTGIDESEQMDTFQNATIHGVNQELVCSLSVRPVYPPNIKTQEQVGEYLRESLMHLSELGWDISAMIGETEEY